MSDLLSRRELFSKNGLKKVFQMLINESDESKNQKEDNWQITLNQWSEPSVYNYALFQEFPMEMITQEAKEKGIPTDGRSKIEIARDVYRLCGNLWGTK